MKYKYIPLGVALGTAIGLALSSVTIITMLPLGTGIGGALGLILSKKQDQHKESR